MGDTSPITSVSTDGDTDHNNLMFDEGHLGIGASDSSDRSKNKMDQKTLRRLAQNREAARKSRLRKKAYVQQLENSRLKLTQLEQELQRARQQGVFISSSGDQAHSTTGDGAMAFDVEYRRWQEDKNRQMKELSSALDSHATDSELRLIVDGVIAHYEELYRIKGNAAKNDVFHLLSGMWKTPAERCFLWLGGFRSSELLKLIANQLEPLTEQQSLDISNLQQSSQQAEDALSQGMDSLQQSLADTLSSGTLGSSSSGNVASYMGQMAMAMGKLGTLEGFIRQADNLRLQTYQQMVRLLTTRQSARALLAVHNYSLRLRALSSLWLARPRECDEVIKPSTNHGGNHMDPRQAEKAKEREPEPKKHSRTLILLQRLVTFECFKTTDFWSFSLDQRLSSHGIITKISRYKSFHKHRNCHYSPTAITSRGSTNLYVVLFI